MGRYRLPTAADFARRGVSQLEVDCSRCPRHGLYTVAGLDPAKPLLHWLVEISSDCPRRLKRNSVDVYDLCGVQMTNVPALPKRSDDAPC